MEIEFKYQATVDQGSELISDLSKKYGSEVRILPMDAVYYDTEDRALRDIHVVYRIRTEGDQTVLTVKYGKGSDKATKGLYRRQEENIPVPADFKDKPGIDVLEDIPVYKEMDKAVGGQYSDLMGVMLPLKKLVPVMDMKFTRRELDVPVGNNGGSATVSYDNGFISAGGKQEPISEVEIELKEGSEAELTEFSEEIALKYGLSPGLKSKYARGIKLLNE